MTNEEYIASGNLELYAAGGLNQEEREEVELRAKNYPEIRAALEEACSAMESYVQLYAVTPAPEVKAKILSSIHNEIKKPLSSYSDKEKEPIALFPPPSDNSIPNHQPEEQKPYKWMLAASVSLFLISGVLSFFFYKKWQQAEDQLAVVAASEQRMANQVETISLESQRLEETLAILRSPDFQPVKLVGVEARNKANMVVYWSAKNQEVFVDNTLMPPPPAGKQYQLWALNNGVPVDAGMLPLEQAGVYLQKMKPISSAQAFAVTLEPIGGSKTPTLELLSVMGEVQV